VQATSQNLSICRDQHASIRTHFSSH